MDWIPTIAGRSGPAYQRIVAALADDIASGALRRGQRLPTHRALARALGLDLTTVTRAYAEARRLQLVDAHVGRGTFVADTTQAVRTTRAMPAIDLTMNLPPQPDGADIDGKIAATLAEVRRQTRFAPHLTYQPAGGSMAERAVVSTWLGTRVPGLARERVLVAAGTQAVLMALLLTLTRPGDTVLTEALTYPGLKAAARLARVTLVAVAMDADGMEPHALAAAGRRFRPRVVVLTPTMHNPTTATMSAARREQIADVIAQQRMTLIEDDPYLFLDTSVAPLAALIPERTYLAASLSKCLAPGLRTSLVVAPDAEAARDAAAALHGVAQMPAPLMTVIVLRWLRDGRADAIIDAVRAEAGARQTLARDVLGALAPSRAETASPHLWLPSPDASSSDRFSEMLRGRGLGVVASSAFAVAEDGPQGVRLALGAARNRVELKAALTILRQVMAGRE